jgi:hypothetical protein
VAPAILPVIAAFAATADKIVGATRQVHCGVTR